MLQKSPIGGTASTRRRRWQNGELNPRSRFVGIQTFTNLGIPKLGANLFFQNKIAGLAMTGELSLTGRVLPVGGIKEKLLAAKRTGIKHVILPKANEADLKEINPEVWKGMKLKFVSTMDECLKLGFG